MKKTNIIFFTGENLVFLNKDLDKWISLFNEKHGDFNISRFSLDNISKINIGAELTTMPFLGSHRLIILEGFPSKAQEKAEEQENKNFDEIILENLEKIPENNIVVFVESTPDKRKSLYKKLLEIAQIKEYNNIEGEKLRNYIRTRLINIDSNAISKLITYKNSSLNKIELEIDKLHLFKMNGRITDEDITNYVIPEIEISIFELTDAIAEQNTMKGISSLKTILDSNSVFQVFSVIMSNLRNFLYINYLLEKGFKKDEIVSTLKIHPFLVDKTRNVKNINNLKVLFKNLVKIDKQSKTGELIGDGENALRLALEKEILNLKK
ncbi:DNA polymerase III subunit delta [Candidatus Gracilibacteria bacterium]|nr:DNA polymerase III subunit delta [Candidatus Gracilibacteria bacterium]